MNCCNSHDHKNEHPEHTSGAAQAKIPTISLSRWVVGFIVALSLIYLFTKVF